MITNDIDIDKYKEDNDNNDDKYTSLNNRFIHTLMNLSLKIKKGQLIGIVGKVGIGKTSLLNSLLNELYLHSGSISLIISHSK
jgi:ABC-type multidrug transport system ATPase subunit